MFNNARGAQELKDAIIRAVRIENVSRTEWNAAPLISHSIEAKLAPHHEPRRRASQSGNDVTTYGQSFSCSKEKVEYEERTRVGVIRVPSGPQSKRSELSRAPACLLKRLLIFHSVLFWGTTAQLCPLFPLSLCFI